MTDQLPAIIEHDALANPNDTYIVPALINAANLTRGAPSDIPVQAAGSSIHAATTMTTPGVTST